MVTTWYTQKVLCINLYILEILADINIQTAQRKSHVRFHQSQAHLIPLNIHPQIQLHDDGFKLVGSAVANAEFLSTIRTDPS